MEPTNLADDEELEETVEQTTDEDRRMDSHNTEERRVRQSEPLSPEASVEEEALDETIAASLEEDPDLPEEQLVDVSNGSSSAEIDPERPETAETDHEVLEEQRYRTPTQYVHEVLDEHLGYIHDLEQYKISGNLGIGFDPEHETISLRYGFDFTPDMGELFISKAEGLPEAVRATLGAPENVEIDVYQGENDLNIDMEWGEEDLEEGTYEAVGHLLNVRDLHPIQYE